MSRRMHRPSAYAPFRADSWGEACEFTAARYLLQGYHPDQLDPATGMPLEGAVEGLNADTDPSVAESALFVDQAEARRERRSKWLWRVGFGVFVVVVLAGVAAFMAGCAR